MANAVLSMNKQDEVVFIAPHFKTSDDMRSYVFDFAHDNQLKILQLNQKNASLESLFRELTT